MAKSGENYPGICKAQSVVDTNITISILLYSQIAFPAVSNCPLPHCTLSNQSMKCAFYLGLG